MSNNNIKKILFSADSIGKTAKDAAAVIEAAVACLDVKLIGCATDNANNVAGMNLPNMLGCDLHRLNLCVKVAFDIAFGATTASDKEASAAKLIWIISEVLLIDWNAFKVQFSLHNLENQHMHKLEKKDEKQKLSKINRVIMSRWGTIGEIVKFITDHWDQLYDFARIKADGIKVEGSVIKYFKDKWRSRRVL